jgi:rod shape-determining protein MreD
MNAGLIRLEGWTRHLVPALVSFALLSAQFLPWGGFAGPIVPCLGLMAIFYWSMRVPGVLPPFAALLLGCFGDLLAMTPLGSQGLVFLTIALLAKYRRRRVSGHAFLGLWSVFAVVCVMQQSFLWLTSALVTWTLLPLGPILPQTLSSIILFPLVTRLILLPVERLVTPHA